MTGYKDSYRIIKLHGLYAGGNLTLDKDDVQKIQDTAKAFGSAWLDFTDVEGCADVSVQVPVECTEGTFTFPLYIIDDGVLQIVNISIDEYGDITTDTTEIAIVQTTGNSTTAVMSQKATTTELNKKLTSPAIPPYATVLGINQSGETFTIGYDTSGTGADSIAKRTNTKALRAETPTTGANDLDLVNRKYITAELAKKANTSAIPNVSTLGKTGKLSDATQDATHRVVTDTEKATWNGKQAALTSISGYDASKAQTLEHDASGALKWVDKT